MYNYPEIPPVLNISQLGEVLKIGRNQAYELAKSNAIHSLKIGKQIRIPRHEVLRLLGVEDTSNK